MSIIDCHTHLGRNEHINASVEQLIASMDKAHIDKSLVFSGEINDCSISYLLDQVKPYKDRLYAVAGVDYTKCKSPGDWIDYAKYLVSLYDARAIVAVKFYVGYDHYYPYDFVNKVVLSCLQKVGCPVIFHSGDCLNSVKKAKLKYSHPLHIDEVAVDFPDINFIIAHMGFPWHRDAAEVCYKNSNVYADISGFVYGSFDPHSKMNFIEVLGDFLKISTKDKLLFGTDWPICDQASYKETISDLTQYFGVTPTVLTENTKKAFRLE